MCSKELGAMLLADTGTCCMPHSQGGRNSMYHNKYICAGAPAPSAAASTDQDSVATAPQIRTSDSHLTFTLHIHEGQTMYCELCHHSYCLFCSREVGVPVHDHGLQMCNSVLRMHPGTGCCSEL